MSISRAKWLILQLKRSISATVYAGLMRIIFSLLSVCCWTLCVHTHRLLHGEVENPWFQTFTVFWMLYAFFWVIPRRLNFICRRFGTLCSIFIGRYLPAYEGGTDSVPKCRHIKFRRRGITQKKAYNKFKILHFCKAFTAEWFRSSNLCDAVQNQ